VPAFIGANLFVFLMGMKFLRWTGCGANKFHGRLWQRIARSRHSPSIQFRCTIPRRAPEKAMKPEPERRV
jgi:hypothetical protein